MKNILTIQSVQSVLKKLPLLPGVYFFKNSRHEIVYIGKAKNLRARVTSYFTKKGALFDHKITSLLQEYTTIEHVVTKNELEALLLEAHLIKRYKPKYNIMLKDGNPFLFILFTQDSLPEIKLVRNKTEKGVYFGPFLHKKEARACFDYLVRTFRLKLCTVKQPQGCLNYHLAICAGTCLTNFDKYEYCTRLDLAKKTLEGDFSQVEKAVKEHIAVYSAQRLFEKARYLHTYLENLPIIFSTVQSKFSENRYRKEIIRATNVTTPRHRTTGKALQDLQELLTLEQRPVTIDCFDISHIQGNYIVGSCIRFTEGIPDTRGFRRFSLKEFTNQNDYAALQEIVSRRYTTSKQRNIVLPDIVLIDGGKGQLNAVRAILPALPCISLAKREERLFTPYHPDGIRLDIRTELGQLLIALRDYAHHFAISYHKLLRSRGAHGNG